MLKETEIIKETLSSIIRITFQIRYHTQPGESLYIVAGHELFGKGQLENALPMQYLNTEYWTATINVPRQLAPKQPLAYHYVLKNEEGIFQYEAGNDKLLDLQHLKVQELYILDSWNNPAYYNNAFDTEPFRKVLLKTNDVNFLGPDSFTPTHTFRVKAPLLGKDQVLCMIGSIETLNNWDTAAPPVLMSHKGGENYWELKLDLSQCDSFSFQYKYAVYNTQENKFVRYENGNNRTLRDIPGQHKYTVINDGFVVMPDDTWKAAGIAIPVFSLRSRSSMGVGEFTDIKLLVDWAKQTGFRLIQLLPVNDTTASHTNRDSYPYSAISAFALHPLYINIDTLIGKETTRITEGIQNERDRLNSLPEVDYLAVMALKTGLLRMIYTIQGKKVFQSDSYKSFYDNNAHWLTPYALFCYLRDEYGTADFNQWPEYTCYEDVKNATILTEKDTAIGFYYFVQYHLHIQLKEAADYAHANGVILKGDIPIGVYRFGADVWQQPDLYHTDLQAGAPPDDFSIKGQNWEFPTYNWQKMDSTGYAWWKQRFEQMSYYFDAFRIDHILGFFRIWSISRREKEGILGYFIPANPVYPYEFRQRGILFDRDRFVKPHITNDILVKIFGNHFEAIRQNFLIQTSPDYYEILPEFATQEAIEKYFTGLEDTVLHRQLKQGMFDLITNVLLLEDSNGNVHFRFGMQQTYSFQDLDDRTQKVLDSLYTDYFFGRQETLWRKSGMQKLPSLKRATNMLVCGEDLGMVPACVPEVMKKLGILSLEIQRMPKGGVSEFFHLANASYLSVVSPSTHDMSTIREWWEEDRDTTQRFYNQELDKEGNAPATCEPWISRLILLQHMQSPAMWSIFQLQDILGIDASARRPNPFEERINVPSNPSHYWRYRMHIYLEDLLQATKLNEELSEMLRVLGRVG